MEWREDKVYSTYQALPLHFLWLSLHNFLGSIILNPKTGSSSIRYCNSLNRGDKRDLATFNDNLNRHCWYDSPLLELSDHREALF